MFTPQHLWLAIAVAVAILLLVFFGDYLWINLIHSKGVDAP